MKHVLPAVMASLLLATGVSAEEAAPQTVKADIHRRLFRQVWPNFSPSCLRNGDRAISVRLVTSEPALTRERSAPALSLAAASVLTVLLERGHSTVPNEQNTQQSPGSGLSRFPQPAQL